MKDKIINVFKGIGIFLVFLISYIIVPQLVGLFFYNVFELNETIAMFIGNSTYAIILLVLYHKMFKEKLKSFFDKFTDNFGDVLKYWGIGLLVMFVSNLILAYVVFPGEIASNEELNRAFIKEFPMIGLISIAVLAPFIEEMIFRFGLRKITGINKYFPLISGVLFGLPHALTEISTPLQLLYIIPYGALGYAFGYLYNKTDNIFSSMCAHAIHNLMCYFIIMFLA